MDGSRGTRALNMIFNLGSLNIDRVFRVAHIARPGETIASRGLAEFAGGKGANQSVALARAGATVAHIGKIGPDGLWLRDKLAAEKVDVHFVRQGTSPTGQAVIQVDDAGQNAIVIVAGANRQITSEEIDAALSGAAAGAWLLVQNETSSVADAIRMAKARGLRVALNPAPFDAAAQDYPLELVDLLCVNETEGAALTGHQSPDAIAAALARRLPQCEILLTLGAEGAIRHAGDVTIRQDGFPVEAVDTTAAGDTFLGYYLAGQQADLAPPARLAGACRAAALCVTRQGAIDSIPRREEVVKIG